MSKKPAPGSGRVAFDDRGQPVGEWRVKAEVFSRDVDTHKLCQLKENAAVKLEDEKPPAAGFDPYSTTVVMNAPKKPRRTLDDMRRLSDEIKRNRERK